MQNSPWQEADQREAQWDEFCARQLLCSCCAHPITQLPYLEYAGIRLCEGCMRDHTVEFALD